jgi:hypothetical protein
LGRRRKSLGERGSLVVRLSVTPLTQVCSALSMRSRASLSLTPHVSSLVRFANWRRHKRSVIARCPDAFLVRATYVLRAQKPAAGGRLIGAICLERSPAMHGFDNGARRGSRKGQSAIHCTGNPLPHHEATQWRPATLTLGTCKDPSDCRHCSAFSSGQPIDSSNRTFCQCGRQLCKATYSGFRTYNRVQSLVSSNSLPRYWTENAASRVPEHN